jgi:hypothetical protein
MTGAQQSQQRRPRKTTLWLLMPALGARRSEENGFVHVVVVLVRGLLSNCCRPMSGAFR